MVRGDGPRSSTTAGSGTPPWVGSVAARSRAGAASLFGVVAPNSGNESILVKYGTEEQKERWLIPLIEGRMESGFSMTEPDQPGSDPRSLKTTARGRADHEPAWRHGRNLSGPLSARGKGTTVLGLRLALGFLVLTAAFGVTYAFDRQASWFGLLPRRVLAHAHLGLLGWLGLAYVAVAEKLWPMFLLAHRPGSRTGDWAVRLLPTGAAVLAAGLLIPNKPVAVAGGLLAGAGLASHLASLAGVIRHRRRPLELLHASPSSPPPPASPLRSPARPPAPPSSSASAAPPSPPPASSPSRTSASARSGPPPTTPKAKGANHDVRPATRRLP